MTISFVGGPYDGLQLSALEIQRIALLFTLATTRGPRKFGVFPHPVDWAEIRSGRMEVDQSRASYYYELVNTVLGPQHQYDQGGKRYREALSEVI